MQICILRDSSLNCPGSDPVYFPLWLAFLLGGSPSIALLSFKLHITASSLCFFWPKGGINCTMSPSCVIQHFPFVPSLLPTHLYIAPSLENLWVCCLVPPRILTDTTGRWQVLDPLMPDCWVRGSRALIPPNVPKMSLKNSHSHSFLRT